MAFTCSERARSSRANRIGLDATGFQPLGNGAAGISGTAGTPTINNNFVSANVSHGIDLSGSVMIQVFANYIGSNVSGLGELGNGGAGVHTLGSSGAINSNFVAQQPVRPLDRERLVFRRPLLVQQLDLRQRAASGSSRAIPGDLGHLLRRDHVHRPQRRDHDHHRFRQRPGLARSCRPGVGLEFFSSPACSKRRPRDFDEGKTLIGGAGFTAFSSPAPFSAEVPVVITDEVVTATVGFRPGLPSPTEAAFGFRERAVFPEAAGRDRPRERRPAGGDPFIIVGRTSRPAPR
jgi:hypothetical protein